MSVLASIEPVELKVDPGREASLTVRVRNRGTIVDRYDIVVVGPTAPWASVDQPSLRLFPDKEGEARVTFRPPRAPNPAADTYPFGIFVKAASDPDASTVEEGRITVAPFVELVTEIVPQTSRGSRSGSHEVTIHNAGNSVADVSIKATDPDRLLSFTITPERTGLRPDGAATVRARVKPKDTFLMGPPKRVPFSVQVDEPTAGSYQLPATLEQQAMIPGWVKPLAGLAIAGLAAIVFLPPLLQGILPAPSGTAAAVASIISPTPTPPPLVTEAPSPESVGPPPTPGPSPSPEVNGLPDTITVAGDATALTPGTGLILKCPRENEECRRNAQTLLLGILTNLQGKADGANLRDFDSTPPGTLPLLVEWRDAVWLYSGVERGETNRVRFDLAPIIAGYPGYALIHDTVLNQDLKYVLPSADGKALFDELYLIEALPTPIPMGTGAPIDYTKIRIATGSWVFISQLAQPTPR